MGVIPEREEKAGASTDGGLTNEAKVENWRQGREWSRREPSDIDEAPKG
jgi:hypothetical protein